MTSVALVHSITLIPTLSIAEVGLKKILGTLHSALRAPTLPIIAAVVSIAATFAWPAPAGAAGGELRWVDQHPLGGMEYSEANDVALDKAGNVFVAASASQDPFLTKYSPAGARLWTRQFGTVQDFASAVTTDLAGNVIVVGGSYVYPNGDAAFVKKYDTLGNELWTTRFGLYSADASDVAVDGDGNIYVVGQWDPVNGGYGFLRRYNSAGAEKWTETFATVLYGLGIDGDDTLYLLAGNSVVRYDVTGERIGVDQPLPAWSSALAVDRDGDVFVAWNTNQAFPGEIYSGSWDAVVAKYDKDLVLDWVDQFGTGSYEQASALAVDASGAVYVSGLTNGVFAGQTPAGQQDGFVRRYGAGGTESWTIQFGTPADEVVHGIAAGPNQTVYAAGYTTGTFPGSAKVTGPWAHESFAAKIMPAGPDVSAVTVSPNPVGLQIPVLLSATVDDTARGGSTVASAGYRLDDGPPVPMSPADGAFDEPTEAVEATIPAFSSGGTHLVCVTGVDVRTNSGPESCTRFTVNDDPPPANQAPVAGDDEYAVEAGETLSVNGPGVLGNDTDRDGDPLTAVLVSAPQHGALTLASDGSFTYTPAAEWSGPDTFSYRVMDPSGQADEAPVVVETTKVLVKVVTRRAGYWMLSADGRVFSFGDASQHGEPAAILGGALAVDIEPTPSGKGYWVAADSGAVYAYGDAPSLGGVGPLRLGERVTSLSATPSGDGYWAFTSAGRVFSVGDAGFFGDMSLVRLNAAVLDSVATPSGQGYFMVASDGGVFAFGDATFRGSMGGTPLNAPVQSLVPDGDGDGYWLVASDGGIFAFNAGFHGSMGSVPLNRPVTGMVPFGGGYLMVAEDGGLFNFSLLPFLGSLASTSLSSPVVAVAGLS